MTRKKDRDAIPPLEWASAALGLLIALVLLGIVGREVIRGGSTDDIPHLTVRVERMVGVPGGGSPRS